MRFSCCRSPRLFGPASAVLLALLLAPAPARPRAAGTEPAGRTLPGSSEAMTTVLERHPEGGFPYRLTLSSKATAESPHRLIVWLHPSGGWSCNAHVESLIPVFLRQRFALVVITEKDFRGWTYEDAGRLLGGVLPDVAGQPGVDAMRPVLLGFSSGGQVALEFWMTKPELYGGLVLDAAYPVEDRDGSAVVLGPPAGEGVRQVPLLAVVGSKDPLRTVWQSAEGPWREAGVPLTVVEVPGKGHEWLFGEEESRILEEWLREIREGGVPGQAVAPPQEEPEPAVQP